MDEGQLLLLWPGEVRRKREGDFGQIGPALLAGTNNSDQSIKEISSTSYWEPLEYGLGENLQDKGMTHVQQRIAGSCFFSRHTAPFWVVCSYY